MNFISLTSSIAVNLTTNKVYVGISNNYIVSIIDGTNDKVIGNVTVD